MGAASMIGGATIMLPDGGVGRNSGAKGR